MSPAEQLLEHVLIFRCQLGDRDAFVELIGRYERPLRYFISRLVGDTLDAEDVFQDTWLKAMAKIRNLKNVEAFRTWLYRIARNRVYQELRKRKYSLLLDEELEAPGDSENYVFSAEDAARIHRSLEDLPVRQREVLMLRFLEQMSYEQISQVIDCNLGTVKSRIYYAKKTLKHKLEEKPW